MEKSTFQSRGLRMITNLTKRKEHLFHSMVKSLTQMKSVAYDVGHLKAQHPDQTEIVTKMEERLDAVTRDMKWMLDSLDQINRQLGALQAEYDHLMFRSWTEDVSRSVADFNSKYEHLLDLKDAELEPSDSI